MTGFTKSWFLIWLFYVLGSVIALRAPVTDGNMLATLLGGFLLLIIQGEVYRKLLNKHGLKRCSFTRHPLYLPLGLALLVLSMLPLYLLGVTFSLFWWLIILTLVLASVYLVLKALGQDLIPYIHTRWLDMLYPLVFLTIVPMDWVEQGHSLKLLILGPLIFAMLGLMLIREARAMMGVQEQERDIPRSPHVI